MITQNHPMSIPASYILRLVHDYLGGGGRFHTLVQHGRFMFHLLRGFATPDNAGRIVGDVT